MKGGSAFDFGPSSNRTKRKVQGLKGVGVNKQTLANKWQPYNTVVSIIDLNLLLCMLFVARKKTSHAEGWEKLHRARSQ